MGRFLCGLLLVLLLATPAQSQGEAASPSTEKELPGAGWVMTATLLPVISRMAILICLLLSGMSFAAAWSLRSRGRMLSTTMPCTALIFAHSLEFLAEIAIVVLVPLTLFFQGWQVALTALAGYWITGLAIEMLMDLLLMVMGAGVFAGSVLLEPKKTVPGKSEHVPLVNEEEPDEETLEKRARHDPYDRSLVMLLRFTGRMFCQLRSKVDSKQQFSETEQRYWHGLRPVVQYCIDHQLPIPQRGEDGKYKPLRFTPILEALLEAEPDEVIRRAHSLTFRHAVQKWIRSANQFSEAEAEKQIERIVADELQRI